MTMHILDMEKNTNTREKHGCNNCKIQANVSEFQGITQSQQSRLVNAECSPKPYLTKLAEGLYREENNFYSGNILIEFENNFLNDGFKQVAGAHHEKKPNQIYLHIKGWFSNHIEQEAIDYLTDYMKAEVRKEQLANKQQETIVLD